MPSEFYRRPLWHVQRLLISLNLVAIVGLVILVWMARGVLFGGELSDGAYVDDAWQWDGASWRRVRIEDPEGDGLSRKNHRLLGRR